VGSHDASGRAGALSVLKQGWPRRLTGGVSAKVWGQRRFKFDSNYNSNGFKQIQTIPNFNRPKRDLPKLENFEIKYCCE
jgi:hypothetical protein